MQQTIPRLTRDAHRWHRLWSMRLAISGAAGMAGAVTLVSGWEGFYAVWTGRTRPTPCTRSWQSKYAADMDTIV